MTLLRLALILFLLCPFAAAPASAAWDTYAIEETGTTVLRFLPTTVPAGEPLPVVIFFPGSGATPELWRMPLTAPAELAGVAVLIPRAVDLISFGIGDDRRTVEVALDRLRREAVIDEERISVAGHSAGAAYAVVYALAQRSGTSGVFALGSPFRIVLDVADPDYTPPVRFYYGTEDPNHTLARPAMVDQLTRLGVPVETQIGVGFGHSTWPDETLIDGFAFLSEQRYATAGGCLPSKTVLCLRDGRFEATAGWSTADGGSGSARVADARTAESGLLTFFSETNWELQIKVLDGCAINGHFWVLAAGTTDVGFRLQIRDLQGTGTAVYEQSPGNVAETIVDLEAFACP